MIRKVPIGIGSSKLCRLGRWACWGWPWPHLPSAVSWLLARGRLVAPACFLPTGRSFMESTHTLAIHTVEGEDPFPQHPASHFLLSTARPMQIRRDIFDDDSNLPPSLSGMEVKRALEGLRTRNWLGNKIGGLIGTRGGSHARCGSRGSAT